jgi:hypothetical protein
MLDIDRRDERFLQSYSLQTLQMKKILQICGNKVIIKKRNDWLSFISALPVRVSPNPALILIAHPKLTRGDVVRGEDILVYEKISERISRICQ